MLETKALIRFPPPPYFASDSNDESEATSRHATLQFSTARRSEVCRAEASWRRWASSLWNLQRKTCRAVAGRRRQIAMKFYYVYILQSEVDQERFYTGFTENLDSRLKSHNSGGCPHTSKYKT